MAKRTFEVQSRPMFPSPDQSKLFELFDSNVICEYSDDTESTNDFDVAIKSDYSRYSESVAIDTAQDSKTTLPAIAGSKTNTSYFTRDTGTWLTDDLVGFRVYLYEDGVEGSGSWFLITSNTTQTLIVSGTVPNSANRAMVQARPVVRSNLQVTPRVDFYGNFFQYTVTKKIPLDGNFKLFGFVGSAIEKNLDPEFFAGMGAISDGWVG